MREPIADGVCTECQKTTRPLVSKNNPNASEMYCAECDISYPMNQEQFNHYAHTV